MKKCKIGKLYKTKYLFTLTFVNKIDGDWIYVGDTDISKNETVLMLERMKNYPAYGVFLYREQTCIILYDNLTKLANCEDI